MNFLMRVGFLGLAGAVCLFADVTYTQTTKFTGGSILEMMHRMPAGANMRNPFQDRTTTVFIKGNKMARVDGAMTAIFDLDAGTMTMINGDTHTYTVQTFDQMREQMQHMQERMNRGGAPSLDFDIKTDNPGQTRTINGQTATETLVTLTAKSSGPAGQAVVKEEVWSVPGDAVMKEATDFGKRLADKFSYAFGGSGAGPAGAAIAAAMKETTKLNGSPIVIDISVSGISTPMGGDPNSPLMQMEVDSSNFSAGPVDDSKFAIPAGYTEAQPSAHSPAH